MNLKNAGILVASGVILVGCVTFAANKEIQLNLTNAVQHIQSVKFADSGSNETSTLTSTSQGRKIEIKTSNFVVTSGNSNEISSSTLSSILGGTGNKITNVTGSTIVAGSNNSIDSSFSVIGGGINNEIGGNSDYSVIAGGEGNKVSGQNSVVAGGQNNSISGNASVTVGLNNGVTGDNSVALGSNARVSANNSFLWTDSGAELTTNDVFAIISQSGMVVNTNEAHPLAQLTIGGSLTIAGSGNVECGGDKGKGSLKLVKKSDDQQCLCSCNGEGWDSILGDGECVAKCAGYDNLSVLCGTGLTLLTGDDGKEYYSGSCINGEVVHGSYYMSASRVHWTCQERDGTANINCSYLLKCEELPVGAIANNSILPKLPKNDSWKYHYSANKGEVCSFSCNNQSGYVKNGDHSCQNVCRSDYDCVKGAKNNGFDSYTQTGEYTCKVGEEVATCNVNCGSDKVRNGNVCINKKTSYCERNHYGCIGESLLKVNNSGDMITGHSWNCVNSVGQIIGNKCRESKEQHKVSLIENIVHEATGDYRQYKVQFVLSGDKVPGDLTISLPWKLDGISEGANSGTTIFELTSGATQTATGYFYKDETTFSTGTVSPIRISMENDYYDIVSVVKKDKYTCYGNVPTGASKNSNQTPPADVKWRYSTNANDVCSYKCISSYHYESAGNTCCFGTNPNSNDYEIFTGGKCRAPDHWEWRFKNGNSYVNTIPWTTNFSNLTGRAQIHGVYFSWSNLSLENKSVNWPKYSWIRNVMGVGYISPFANPSYFSLADAASNQKKVTVNLANFYSKGIPLVTSQPKYDLLLQTDNIYNRILNLTFNSNQPTITRTYSPTQKQSKTLYGYVIQGGVTETSNVDYGNVAEVKPFTLTAEATPIYSLDCEGATIQGKSSKLYYHVSPLKETKTLSVRSEGGARSCIFVCEKGVIKEVPNQAGGPC